MSINPLNFNSFTLKSKGGLLRMLLTPVEFSLPGLGVNKIKFNGVWDTGATATVITQNVVSALNLKPIGIAFVNTASQQNVQTPEFLVDVHLYDGQLCIPSVRVTLGNIGAGADCLIGMDIITLGDFSITNVSGITTFSFRVPSVQEIDFTKQLQHSKPKIGPHVLCPCGSGKYYKNCHGSGL